MKRLLAVILICVLLGTLVLAGCSPFKNKEEKTTMAEVSVSKVSDTDEEEEEDEVSKWLYPAYTKDQKGTQWGYINSKGKFVIQPEYDRAEDFEKCGLAIIRKDEQYGLINMNGKIVQEPVHDYISFADENLFIISDENSSKLVNKEGKVIFETDGFIHEFSNGVACFSKSNGDSSLFGYIDRAGKIILEPQYDSAGAFQKNKSLVETAQGSNAIIDKKGKILVNLPYKNIKELSDNTLMFANDDNSKYGYLSDSGTVLIDAKYGHSYPFKDGCAVVNNSDDSYENTVGLINKKGEFLIESKYQSIYNIGEGLYAVVQKSEYYSTMHAPVAIFNKQGKQLTDFIYYDVEDFSNGIASVTDEKSTFFINKKGEIVDKLPKLSGIGSMKIQEDLIKAEIDNDLMYLTKDGDTVWKADDTFKLDKELSVKEIKFRPDRATLVVYPELSGMKDKDAQTKINFDLKQAFVGEIQASEKEGGEYVVDIKDDFDAELNKDLIIIAEGGYYYPIGAAHGQPSQTYYHIDRNSGKIYSLSDLFKKDSSYVEVISNIIRKQIYERELNDQDTTIWKDSYKGIRQDQDFIITKDALQIYFYPYEIGPYSSGFVTFNIPYNEIMDILDTNGALWKSFDKNVASTATETRPETMTDTETDSPDSKVEEAMKKYETNIIEAINSNDFSIVEPSMVPGSNLYNSQQKLVTRLSEKNIKEKLVGFTIDDIKWTAGDNSKCKVYTTDSIAIQYPGEDFETKQFRYVYSLSYNEETDEYQLYDIEALK